MLGERTQHDTATATAPATPGAGADAGRGALTAALLAVAAGVFVYHARIYWGWTEDDAFISFRYAWNLVAGHGLVFNPGERVEGYSNFTWVMLMAAVLRAGGDPEVWAKVFGVASGVGCVFGSWLLVRRMRPGVGLTALLAPLYLAMSPVLVQHAVNGLETSFFAALVLAGALLLRGPGWAFTPVAILITVTRPEGAALAVLLLLARAWLRARDGGRNGARARRRGVLVEAAVWAAAAVAFEIWRLRYYGAPLPNTFYAKERGGLHGLIDGAQYTLDFLRDAGGPLFLGLGVLPFLTGRVRPHGYAVLALALAYMAFAVVSGGDWMYNYRFYAHVLPLFAALLAAGLDNLLELLAGHGWRTALAHVTVAALLLATFLALGNTELRVARMVLPAVASHNYLSQNYEELGLWLKENTPPDATVAISDVGAVGYFSQRHIIDMFGLIDPHIARLRGRMHYKADPRYVLSRQPDVVILVSLNDEGVGYSFQRIPDYAMNTLPEFHQNYELVRTVPQNWNNEFVLVYRRAPEVSGEEGESP